MPTRDQLIRIGARRPSPRLMEQADYSLGLAREDAPGLQGSGWGSDRTGEVERLRGEIGRLYADQATARQDVPQASAAVTGATRAAKAWKRKLLLFAANAFEDEREKLNGFFADGAIGDSTPRLVAYLERVAPLCQREAAALSAWGAPADFAAEGRRLLAALADADRAQELTVENLPAATAALYEAKGGLYTRLKQLNRCGRALHDGDAARAARYNLDILLRHGRERPAGAGGGGAGAAAPSA